jgi:hypothetical protein
LLRDQILGDLGDVLALVSIRRKGYGQTIDFLDPALFRISKRRVRRRCGEPEPF